MNIEQNESNHKLETRILKNNSEYWKMWGTHIICDIDIIDNVCSVTGYLKEKEEKEVKQSNTPKSKCDYNRT